MQIDADRKDFLHSDFLIAVLELKIISHDIFSCILILLMALSVMRNIENGGMR